MTARPITLTGVVMRQTVAQGSKSEREALVLVCEGLAVALRRFGSPALGPDDEELTDLIGETITVTGNIQGPVLIFREIQ